MAALNKFSGRVTNVSIAGSPREDRADIFFEAELLNSASREYKCTMHLVTAGFRILIPTHKEHLRDFRDELSELIDKLTEWETPYE